MNENKNNFLSMAGNFSFLIDDADLKNFIFYSLPIMSSNSSSSPSVLSEFPKFTCFRLSFPASLVLQVEISTNSVNSLPRIFWSETVELFRFISTRTDAIRAVILTNSGELFTAGLDLKDHAGTFGPPVAGEDFARKSIAIKAFVHKYQETISVLEEIPQPVIAAVHGPCIGGGK